MPEFSSYTDVTDDTATLHLVGDIDITAAEAMAHAGLGLLHDHGVRALLVDCSSVVFCDSTALGIIVSWHQDALLQHKSLCLRALPPQMSKIMAITGLDKVFDIED